MPSKVRQGVDEPVDVLSAGRYRLLEDELVIAAARASPWARRRKLDIAELRYERWILTSGDRWNYQIIANAFRLSGVEMPNIGINTLSVHLRANMVATGRFIATFPRPVLDLYADRLGLKALSVVLPQRKLAGQNRDPQKPNAGCRCGALFRVHPRHREFACRKIKDASVSLLNRAAREVSRSLLRRGRCPLWVMCGRRLGKNFLTLLQHWSGAVMCPACLCGRSGRWP
jgi:DNA-binding transcriptional LysR family regulator